MHCRKKLSNTEIATRSNRNKCLFSFDVHKSMKEKEKIKQWNEDD